MGGNGMIDIIHGCSIRPHYSTKWWSAVNCIQQIYRTTVVPIKDEDALHCDNGTCTLWMKEPWKDPPPCNAWDILALDSATGDPVIDMRKFLQKQKLRDANKD